MRVILKSVFDGTEYRIDTPDAKFIGPWLKMLFDEWSEFLGQPGRYPIEFTLEVR